LSKFSDNYHKIISEIPSGVELVCVTKYVGLPETKEIIAAGAKNIGESRVQLAREKIKAIDEPVNWHMIGPLQKNKAKHAVPMFELIQSVDSLALAQEIDRQARENRKTTENTDSGKYRQRAAKTWILSRRIGRSPRATDRTSTHRDQWINDHPAI
jgi:uncharacterized pyridoxal phosphate-containing UPF0001 family protein